MIKLRAALQEYLKNLHPNVYFQLAPNDAVFPYIVYDIPNTLPDGEGYESVTVDIDGWDSPKDGNTTSLENLMQMINSLDKRVLLTDEIAATFFLENKIPIIDDDKRIKRRKYIYSARLFERS